MQYYNYVTGRFDDVSTLTTLSAEQQRKYIPQTTGILDIYDASIKMGISPREAAHDIHLACSQGKLKMDDNPPPNQEGPPTG